LAILDIDQKYHLPQKEIVFKNAQDFLDTFLEDANKTNEPAGTIAYWPLIETPNGKWIRSFSTQIPYRNLKVFNVPNDLDASANLYVWFLKTNQNQNYRNGFEQTVGQFIDTNRSEIYPNDLNWKSKNSGAFLTWAESDRHENSASRIFRGINDVDCVVNLNILTALLSSQKSVYELSSSTNLAFQNSCQLINETVNSNKFNQCAVWYDRPSQFFTAYSKTYLAQKNKNDCLNPSINSAKQKLISMSKQSLQIKKNITETAEYLSSMKRIWPASERTKDLLLLINSLDQKIRNQIVENSTFAYLPSTDSLFIAKIGPIKVEWYSEQFSTALALQALLLP
jgi:hypothetical protein